jgi:hypothetical protein
MCFSARASFVASALLLAIGAVTLRSASTPGQRDKLPLAAAPLLFGVQQACEGVVWLGLPDPSAGPGWDGSPSTLVLGAALSYLFFAYAFWPVWMPLAAAALMPPTAGTVRLSRALPLAGVVPGVLLWLPLLRDPRSALPLPSGHTLIYPLNPWVNHLLHPLVGPTLYAALIGLALLLVPSPQVRIFAVTLLLTFALTEWANRQALTSLWCYASALLSAQILWIVAAAPAPCGPAEHRGALAPRKAGNQGE